MPVPPKHIQETTPVKRRSALAIYTGEVTGQLITAGVMWWVLKDHAKSDVELAMLVGFIIAIGLLSNIRMAQIKQECERP
jgi:hypothetical protein